MRFSEWSTEILFVTDLLVRIGLAVRIIMRRRPPGVSLAWLAVVLIFPFAGAVVYLTFGELRLGRRRALWVSRTHEQFQRWQEGLWQGTRVDWGAAGTDLEPLARLADATGGIPALPGNELELLTAADHVFPRLEQDIDTALDTCHLEFYIWQVGGAADRIAEALLRAASRGVVCRVLVDGIGSREFLKSHLCRRLRAGGVAVRAALPSGLVRSAFVRFDLRLHRKIAIIDSRVAYTGSMNLVDPCCFRQEAHVGQWVDAMVRARGPAVAALAATFIEDWDMETREGLDRLAAAARPSEPCPGETAAVQVVPSGPLLRNDAIQQILLMAIYAARRELVLTTPYFVVDDALLTALVTAARRGVAVTVVVPARVDSRLVALASRGNEAELVAAGVRMAHFRGGLLHTKSITVDGGLSLFGSLNLDPRSLYLNFEITLVVYDRDFTGRLRQLQELYIGACEITDHAAWEARPRLPRLVENAARLLAPLL